MNAYVTLLSSDDYLKPVLILNRNLKELNSMYPLYVMVTDEIKPETIKYLEKEQVQYQIVPTITYSDKTIAATPSIRLQKTASKINIFNLEQFDRVVYMDADGFFIKTIDELFEYPDGALYNENGTAFTNLFVCDPQNHSFNLYYTLLKNTNMWDGDLIEQLWFPFKTNELYSIPSEYHVTITVDLNNLYPLEQKLFGLHFCSEFKPWQYKTAKDYLYDFKCAYSQYSKNREELVAFYFNHYLEPLKKDYPELFT